MLSAAARPTDPTQTAPSSRARLRSLSPTLRPPCAQATMSDEEQQLEYLAKINEENAALQAEIARIEASKTMGATKAIETAAPAKAPGSGICVLDFGSLDHAESAGIDRGSASKPPQCARRTLTGGFFTS